MKQLFGLVAIALLAAPAFAQIPLREDTAAQIVMVGPFVDSGDGDTEETGLTIANTDIRISKNGATAAAKNSGGCTHDADGMYNCTLDATDTSTVGRLTLWAHIAGTIFIRQEYQVLEEAVYDAALASGATDVWAAAARTLTAIDEDSTTLDLNATTVGAVAVFDEDSTTIDINATTIGTVTTATTATNVTTVNGLAAGVVTAAAIATGAIDADATSADFRTEDQEANIVALGGTAITCTAGASCGP